MFFICALTTKVKKKCFKCQPKNQRERSDLFFAEKYATKIDEFGVLFFTGVKTDEVTKTVTACVSL